MNRVAIDRLKRRIAQDGGAYLEDVVGWVGQDEFDDLLAAGHIGYYREANGDGRLVVVAFLHVTRDQRIQAEQPPAPDFGAAAGPPMSMQVLGRLGYPAHFLEDDDERARRERSERAARAHRDTQSQDASGPAKKPLTEQEAQELLGDTSPLEHILRANDPLWRRIGAPGGPGAPEAGGHRKALDEADRLQRAADTARMLGDPDEADLLARRAGSIHRIVANAETG